MTDKMINIALPKGRLGEKVYKIFEAAGFGCEGVTDPQTRKLIFENHEAGVCYFWVKPSDVAIYVERGAADIGVAGKDILLEYSPDVYELFDLGIGKCRMCVAAKKGFRDSTDKTLTVDHKVPRHCKRLLSVKIKKHRYNQAQRLNRACTDTRAFGRHCGYRRDRHYP